MTLNGGAAAPFRVESAQLGHPFGARRGRVRSGKLRQITINGCRGYFSLADVLAVRSRTLPPWLFVDIVARTSAAQAMAPVCDCRGATGR
jgi:hypothetical protein